MSDHAIRTTIIVVIGMVVILLLVFFAGDFFPEPMPDLAPNPVQETRRPPF